MIIRDTRESELGARRSEHPTNVSDRLNLARHYMDEGKFGMALPEIQAACVLAPGSVEMQKMLREFETKVGVHMADFVFRETK